MLFQNILLPIDINDSNSWEKTLPTCISILKLNPEAKLWFLAVIPNFGLGDVIEEYFPKGWLKDVSEKTLIELQKIVENHLPHGIKPNLLVDRGVVYQVILDTALKLEVDLIVMSSNHPNRKDYLLGPNVARVARHAESSVLIRR
ncbi:MAG: universal stress protein [Rickettsiales bacterium]